MDKQITEIDGVFYCDKCNTNSIMTKFQRKEWRQIFEAAHKYCYKLNGGEKNGKT